MKQSLFHLFTLFIVVGCNNNKVKQTSIGENDPYRNTIAQTQFHRINTNKDTVIVGNSGTKITILKGAFISSEGEEHDSVSFELFEALKLEDMLLSNLTTTSNGKILETDGMIYFNVLDDNGDEVKINPEKPLYVEIPTKKNKANMKLYKGVRDDDGNMNWVKPKPLQNNLSTLPLDELDFLPPRFEEKVKRILKINKLTKASKDSIYYSFSFQSGFTYFNEYYQIDMVLDCGIDPSSIKILKSKEYKNTYVATKAFERRLKVIHSKCSDLITTWRDGIVEMYAENLEKDLWKVDLMVDSLVNRVFLPRESKVSQQVDSLISRGFLPGESEALQEIGSLTNNGVIQKVENRDNTFLDFSKEKLLNVKNDKEHLKELNAFFGKEMRFLKDNYNSSSKKMTQNEEKQENLNLNQFVKKEKELKKKRETQRMETYGFVATESGWYNIDTGEIPKSWNYQYIKVNLAASNEYKTIHVYSVFKSKKVITKLASYNLNETYEFDKSLESVQVPKNKEASIVIIASNDKQFYYNSSTFITKKEDNAVNEIEVKLSLSELELIKNKLKELDEFSSDVSVIEEYKLSDTIQKIKYSEFENRKKNDSMYLELKKAVFPCYEIELGMPLRINNTTLDF